MDSSHIGMVEQQIVVSNIQDALVQASHKHHIALENLDFSIHNISDLQRGEEFFYRDYTIDIFQRGFSPVELHYSLKTASNTTSVRFYQGSSVDVTMATPLEVLTEIKKVLAKEGVVYGVYDDETLYRIAAAVHRAFVEKSDIPDEPFAVASGQNPRASADLAYPTYHFDRHGLIASGGGQEPMLSPFEMGKDTFIVREGELLITEPILRESQLQISTSGYIVNPVNGPRLPFHDFSPDIRREQTPEAYLYYAEKDGYLSVEKGTLLIRPQVSFESDVLDSKDAAQAKKREDIVLSASDETKDAVSAGQVIEGRNVTINGHVGAGAIIRGLNVTINGVLHKDACIEAEHEAVVDISKGTVRADRAKINMLEGGTVEATSSVEVLGKSMQSVIKSPRIFINELKNCSVTTGGYQIRINTVSDGTNFFTIDPLTIESVNTRYQMALGQQKELLKKLKAIRQSYNSKKNQLADVRKQYEPLRGKIEKLRRQSSAVPSAFQNIVERHNSLTKEVISLKQQAQVIVRQLSTLEDFIYRIQYVETTTSFTVYKRLPKGNILKYGKSSAHITIDQDLAGVTVGKNRAGKLEYRLVRG
ncbi:FapA family protein [Desulfurispirillum indicum]|uniref:FapA family protein n=1 Tax=Desulfurispirillum indicum TaxID=936456 RepID=UPI001CFA51A2|nr:FapA family protein [Desulfurispirillum indicum]UCZ57157.1 FapA family protein [Desulfurispirillum indicum]